LPGATKQGVVAVAEKGGLARRDCENFSGGGIEKMWRLIPALVLAVAIFWAAPALAAGDAGSGASGAVNLFAFDLYKRLASEEEGNVFFSPYSVSSAMAMLYAGAAGDAERELRDVMRYQDGIHESMGELNGAIADETQDATVLAANAIWPDLAMELKPSYVDTVRKYYGSDVTRLDFRNNWRTGEDTINEWVYAKTKGEIKDLFARDSLAPQNDRQTAIVLTNAVYFKAGWLKSFDAGKTKDAPFFGKSAEKNVPMMSVKGNFEYARFEDFQMIRLPYKGKTHSMAVILPNRDGFGPFEKGFSSGEYFEYRKALKSQEVTVSFPKFDLELAYSLAETFSKMGLKSIFRPSRDNFSNMGRTKDDLPLSVSQIVHKAKVKVDEDGTVAAAATGIGMVGTTSFREPTVFRADHPFIFLITDDRTDTILFMGRYIQP
jgi:serpin B